MKFSALLLLLAALPVSARFPEATPDSPGRRMLDRYFQQQVREIEETGGLKHIGSAEQWREHEPEYRRQLAEMLGLEPMPERTPLLPVKTGELKEEGFRVEKMHFQAVPGYYVTANLYLPEKVEAPCPAILYVCGHANVVKDGVSLGNKTGYHHHGVWFARHGYVCLIIDTVQLGEIRGEHHGTYSKGRWWWFSRGYTPAGLEAWAGMRALDFLETRLEVDKTRFGVTGRSGGGAYSWWVAALDERIKAAAPTAGVTSLKNHVVDGCVEGHCDCMYFVNTYRWDFDRLAALVAPRSLSAKTLAPRASGRMKASAWMDTNRSACTRRALRTRSCSGTKWSPLRVSMTRRPRVLFSSSRSWREMASTTSFSRSPVGPMAPGSSPPWPGSMATMTSRSTRRRSTTRQWTAMRSPSPT